MSKPIPDINYTRCDRLRQLIKEVNLTQEKFAFELNVSQQLISSIVNYKASLTEKLAYKITTLFPQYNISWLMALEADVKSYEIEPILEEINSSNIARQIEIDNLSNWCKEIQTKILKFF